jgi:hypothetical protein
MPGNIFPRVKAMWSDFFRSDEENALLGLYVSAEMLILA